MTVGVGWPPAAAGQAGWVEAWEDNPEGWPEAPQADSPVGGQGSAICWYWRSDADGVATWGPTSRPVPQYCQRDAVSMTKDDRLQIRLTCIAD
jgi:hypothetical protein